MLALLGALVLAVFLHPDKTIWKRKLAYKGTNSRQPCFPGSAYLPFVATVLDSMKYQGPSSIRPHERFETSDHGCPKQTTLILRSSLFKTIILLVGSTVLFSGPDVLLRRIFDIVELGGRNSRFKHPHVRRQGFLGP